MGLRPAGIPGPKGDRLPLEIGLWSSSSVPLLAEPKRDSERGVEDRGVEDRGGNWKVGCLAVNTSSS